MSHLRLVRDEPPPPPKPPGPRHETVVFTPEEQRKLRQAIRNLKTTFGTWKRLADAMGMGHKVLMKSIGGRQYGLSPGVVIRAMRVSGFTLDELLGEPAPADRCRACGQIKRAS